MEEQKKQRAIFKPRMNIPPALGVQSLFCLCELHRTVKEIKYYWLQMFTAWKEKNRGSESISNMSKIKFVVHLEVYVLDFS